MMSLYLCFFLSKLLLIILINSKISPVHSACNTTFTCLNYGLFNNQTCDCDCFEPYDGDRCEYANCTFKPTACGTTITKSQCTDPLIKAYCPDLCQSDICTCGFNTCENSGVFNINTCSCQCFPNYSGKRCENLLCNVAEPSVCRNYSSNCNDSVIKSYCPHTCNVCCPNPLSCQNSGIFDKNSCDCQCFYGYDGDMCEILDCTDIEPTNCALFTTSDCSNKLINDYCFKKCGKCK